MTDTNDAAALIGAFDVEDYVAGYEFRGDGGDYMPNDQDRSLLIDAIHGAIGEMQDNLRNAQSEAVAWGNITEFQPRFVGAWNTPAAKSRAWGQSPARAGRSY